MRLVLLGPPGAGKGTQSKLLGGKFKIRQISTGEILRRVVKEKTELGQKAKSFMDQGKLVPDDVVIGIIKEELERPDFLAGFILDGFPRTIQQAEELRKALTQKGQDIDHVIDIEIDYNVLLERLTGRRACSDCGEGYHKIANWPKKEGICDKCGGKLYQRDDDDEETIQKRFEVYEKETEPLKDYYRKYGKLRSVKGVGGFQEIFLSITNLIQQGVLKS